MLQMASHWQHCIRFDRPGIGASDLPLQRRARYCWMHFEKVNCFAILRAIQATLEIVYFAEVVFIVLKKGEDFGTMPALRFTRIMFGLQIELQSSDALIGIIGNNLHL